MQHKKAKKALRDITVHVIWPDDDELDRLGRPDFKDIPVCFGPQWDYLDAPNAYLHDRAYPTVKNLFTGEFEVVGYTPTRNSLKAWAASLTDLLQWCLWRGLDWRNITYAVELLQFYVPDQRSGDWSFDNFQYGIKTPVQDSTIKRRLGEAVRFLEWAAREGLRAPLNVAYETRVVVTERGDHSHGHRLTKKIQVRSGERFSDGDRNPKIPRLPTHLEVAEWLKELGEIDPVWQLMAKLILATGLRRETVVRWPLDLLPPQDHWVVKDRSIVLKISQHLKGRRTVNKQGNRTQSLKRLTLTLPVELAEELDTYRTRRREILRRRFVRNGQRKGKEEKERRKAAVPEGLFLSPGRAQNMSLDHFTAIWRKPKSTPPGWHVHLGRHYFTCMSMLEAVADRKAYLSPDELEQLGRKEPGWMKETALDKLKELRSQLGHEDARTTQIYLAWLKQVRTPEIFLGWQNALREKMGEGMYRG